MTDAFSPGLRRDLTLDVGGSAMPFLVYEPEGGEPQSAVILVMEAFGVNDHMRDVASRIAGEGHLVVVPDFFHRLDTKVVPYDNVPEAIRLCCTLTNELLIDDVAASLDWLSREYPKVPVGILGFCFGGRTAFLAAARFGDALKATVVFYGGGIVTPIPVGSPPILEVASITSPVLGLFGAEDDHIPLDQVDQIQQALNGAGVRNEMIVYPDAGHGFFCDARPNHYAPDAARKAWDRAVAFLDETLRKTNTLNQ